MDKFFFVTKLYSNDLYLIDKFNFRWLNQEFCSQSAVEIEERKLVQNLLA